MTKYLVDTTVFISHLRGFTPATKFLLHEQGLTLSYVTIVELMQGAKDTVEIRKIKRLVQSFAVHWGSEKVNKLALEFVEQYHLSHKAHILDMLIAATAMIANFTLVTDNIKDFQFIPGFRAQKPSYK